MFIFRLGWRIDVTLIEALLNEKFMSTSQTRKLFSMYFWSSEIERQKEGKTQRESMPEETALCPSFIIKLIRHKAQKL